jgi:hypothetical protein
MVIKSGVRFFFVGKYNHIFLYLLIFKELTPMKLRNALVICAVLGFSVAAFGEDQQAPAQAPATQQDASSAPAAQPVKAMKKMKKHKRAAKKAAKEAAKKDASMPAADQVKDQVKQ